MTINWGKAQEGCSEEIEVAVEKYYKVAYKVALKWTNGGIIEYEDALGLASLALMKCIYSNKFDPDRSKFISYLCRSVDNEVRMFLRKENKHNRCVEFDTVEQMGEMNMQKYMLVEESPEEIIEEKELSKEAVAIWNQAKRYMTESEIASFSYSLCGLAQWEIAEILGLSQSYVSRLISRAKDKLHDAKRRRGGYV